MNRAESASGTQLLDGGWDLDSDGNPEWLVLVEAADGSNTSTVVYYESVSPDSATELWRYTSDPGVGIADGTVAALRKNATPSLVLLLVQNADAADADFNWLISFAQNSTAELFPPAPTSRWNHGADTPLRPRAMEVADMDDDGDQELIISTFNQPAVILLVDYRGGFIVRKTFSPGPLGDGSSPDELLLADMDGDLRSDIVVVGSGPDPTLKAYINGRNGFVERTLTGINGPYLLSASAKGDLNGDGQEEVVLVSAEGDLTLVTMVGPRLSAEPMGTRIAGLVDLVIYHADADTVAEMVFLLSDGSLASNDPDLQLPNIASSPASIGSLLPIVLATGAGALLYSTGSATGAVLILPSLDGEAPVSMVIPGDVADAQEDLTGGPDAQTTDISPQLEAGSLMLSQEGSEVYFPAQQQSYDPRALPPNRTPDHVIHPGEEFARELVKKFAYHKMIEQMNRRGATIVDEQLKDDGSIVLTARQWH
ncbi:MAG: VCBS repeat-containing protein [Candidatus Marinimicrobia bacterium]|nr:VCBS repeat-containing protein [Candidatus Neomarinimicrobiota bacterium]